MTDKINTYDTEMFDTFPDNNNEFEADNEIFENDDNFEDDGGWDDTDVKIDDWNDDNDIIDINTVNEPIEQKQMNTIKSYSAKEIDSIINNKIKLLSDELSLESETCLLLLRRYKWNMNKVMDIYFTNTNKILINSGVCIHKKQNSINSTNKNKIIECRICMNDVEIKNTFCLDCGHINTCKSCWIQYLIDGVKTKQSIFLTCPTYKCNVIIPYKIWKLLLQSNYNNFFLRYERFCRENFIENGKNFCFCPGRSCDIIYSFEYGEITNIFCSKCNYSFCSNCKNESHLPSSCDTAIKWLQKCSSESENIQWILARTKRCPKCHVHIEKNQGCNHMTCGKNAGGCGHEFCWLCKGDWKKHNSSTGGYYKCNIYEKNKKKGVISNEEESQENAKNELERYEFHYTRYDSHLKSSIHAREQRLKTEEKMQELADKFEWRLNEAQFLLDAVNEVIKCWYVLAWTYPIAYYLDNKQFNIDLFKEQQGELETFCDGLQGKLDFDLEKLGDIRIRQEIIGYTRTAKKYRTNLVEYIESDISF